MPTQASSSSFSQHAQPSPPRLVSISLSSGIGGAGTKTEEAWAQQGKYEGSKSQGDALPFQLEGPAVAAAAAAAAAAGKPRPRWLTLLLLGLGIVVAISVVGALIASFHNEILDGE
jgi:hypothetical protein